MEDAVTQARADLTRYLQALAPHSAKAALLLERGEWFEWSPRPAGLDREEAKQCYANAGRLALFDGTGRGLTYVEGYVVTPRVPFPIDHAWTVDEDGNVVDTTLRQPGDDACGFCGGNGYREQCAPDGVYGDLDPDCEECGGGACYPEAECFWCKGTGREEDPAEDLTGAVYFGVRVEADLVRRTVLGEGTWTVLDKPSYYEAVDFRVDRST